MVGKLLDLECAEDFIKNLLNSVGQLCPVAELVEQVTSNYILRTKVFKKNEDCILKA